MSRRRVVAGSALAGAGLVVGAGGAYAVTRDDSASTGPDRVPFFGRHQAGILTPQQGRMVFAAFDVTTEDSHELQAMLGRWAAAASLMTAGTPIGPFNVASTSVTEDTGEALGLGPANLTVTVGFGPSLFDHRFGLKDKRPAALAPLPDLPGDGTLDPTISNGDLCVQACADDPQVAFHVIRDFAQLGRGTAVLRYAQVGFGRASVTSEKQTTPRNLMGFKDGTANLKVEEPSTGRDFVWVGDETDQPWMKDGSYLVVRKIRMQIEAWDTDSLKDQQDTIGRTKVSGAPLGYPHEHSTFDPAKLPVNSHVGLAASLTHRKVDILRRGYNYADGIVHETGQIDSGLFFLAYQKNAHEQFVPLQRLLGQHDRLNEYIKHVSSALFAIPPGLARLGDWYGKQLFS